MTQQRSRPCVTVLPLLLVAILMLGTAVATSACDSGLMTLGSIRGSGDLKTQEYGLADFSGLEIGNAFVVTVTQSGTAKSDTYSVTITADDNILDLIDVEKIGQTLIIDLDSTTRVSDVTLRANITMPALGALKASGATRATISGFSSKDALALEASGASAIAGVITAGVVGIDVSGASKIELAGTATEIVAEVSGASHLLLADFLVTHAKVDVSGASDASVNLTGRLDADVSGASRLRYLGDPTMGDISTSGASTIERL